VVDELHMLADPERGHLIELLLTKLRYYAATAAKAAQEAAEAEAAAKDTPAGSAGSGPDSSTAVASRGRPTGQITPLATGVPTTTGGTSSQPRRPVQIIGMSATLPNLPDVAAWLDAATYVTKFRPVVLHRYLKAGNALLAPPPPGSDPAAPLQHARSLPPPAPSDPDHIAQLTGETVGEGHSVLIFCATKNTCVQEVRRLQKALTIPERNVGTEGQPPPVEHDDEDGGWDLRWDRESVALRLEAQGFARSAELATLVRAGLAYHNSDLSQAEKELVEGAYRAGALSVLCATPTLAAGVNLPARRVIFLHAYNGLLKKENYLTATKYRQMAGRAGRAGIDDLGEAILIQSARGVPRAHLEYLLRGTAEEIRSCLAEGRKGKEQLC